MSILWMTGNHDGQVGDRQPEGERFNSGDYAPYLPETTSILTEKAEGVDVGSDVHVLCYETWIKGIPFLVLNTPRYPLDSRARFPDRFGTAHSMKQAEWLNERLLRIEEKLGKNSLIFVSSHYPFHLWDYIQESPEGPENQPSYVKMYEDLNRYPNLIFFYGHVHGGDRWVNRRETAENSEMHSRLTMYKGANGRMTNADCLERGFFRSDVVVGTGIRHEFAGSMAYFKNSYFANDGVKVNTWLCEIEVPFFQQLVAEVYEDRVVLTMENLGTKKGVYDHLPNATYKLKPLIVPLKK